MYSTTLVDLQPTFFFLALGESKELSTDMEGSSSVSLMGKGFFGEVGGVGVLFFGRDLGWDYGGVLSFRFGGGVGILGGGDFGLFDFE